MRRGRALPGFFIRGSARPGDDIEGNWPAGKRAKRSGPPAGTGGSGLFPGRSSPPRLAGFGAAPLSVGGFGETADRLGFVVVDVEDSIEFSNLQKVMNLLRKV